MILTAEFGMTIHNIQTGNLVARDSREYAPGILSCLQNSIEPGA
jgi:hypothetical protein